MIHVNLLPVEDRPPEPRTNLSIPKRGFWIPLVLGIAVLVPLAGIAVMQQMKIMSLRSDIAAAEVETQRLKPQIDRIHTLMKERAEINQRLMTVQGLARGRYLPVQILDELSDRTPEYLWFTKVQHTPTGGLNVEGMTFSNLLIAELMMRMEEGDLFAGTSLSVSERKRVGEHEVLRFNLSTQVRP